MRTLPPIAISRTVGSTFRVIVNGRARQFTFANHFGITLAADMYTPKNYEGKLAAIAVCGPYSAVKEQVSGLYAQEMARRGFLTIAFDPSYYGESGGLPRYINAPDFNVEDFHAAVDFLSAQENVDPERIGIIGICGWGGYAHKGYCDGYDVRHEPCYGTGLQRLAE